MQGVAKNFREIFAELAPGGKGELVMQKAPDGCRAPAQVPEDDEDAEDLPAEADSAFESYIGVKVKVSSAAADPAMTRDSTSQAHQGCKQTILLHESCQSPQKRAKCYVHKPSVRAAVSTVQELIQVIGTGGKLAHLDVWKLRSRQVGWQVKLWQLQASRARWCCRSPSGPARPCP